MPFGRAVLVAASFLYLLGNTTLAEAQRQKYKMGGGAGFATIYHPNVDVGRTFALGGFFGLRFNDNISLEANFNFVNTGREYGLDGIPVDEVATIPEFRFETTRYNLDANIMYNFGRRQPFHPYIVGGVGVIRWEERRIDIEFTFDPENPGAIIGREDTVTIDTRVYEPAVNAGAGFEFYFMYNVAARAEFRVWVPQTTDRWQRQFFFEVSYYF